MKTFSLTQLSPSLKATVTEFTGQLASVMPYAKVEEFEPGEKIVSSNKTIETLRYLIQGKAKVCLVHENGKVSILDFIGSGDYIGELSFLEIETQPKDVIAISPCICLCFPFYLTKKRLADDPEFLFGLNQYLGKKMLKRSWFYAKSQNYELKHRLAAHILRCEVEGVYKEKHTETAEFLGISYRHLLYALQKMQQQGLLTKTVRGYKIDRPGLTLLAKDIRLGE